MERVKIAVLIDAENVSPKYIKLILDEMSEYGLVTYKKVYGDFSIPSVLAWKENIREYAMTPVFQINYTKGKSASDSALVIDAMDILYSGNVSGFCLVTSDSDFTKLAIRLRDAGMTVIGMGEQKTSNSLVAACESFKYLDLLYKESVTEKVKEQGHIVETTADSINQTVTEVAVGKSTLDTNSEGSTNHKNGVPDKDVVRNEIASIIEARADESGWLNIATLGSIVTQRIPGFDSRNYGYQKLKYFLDSFECFEMYETKNPKNKILKVVYIKNKLSGR